MQIKFFLIFLLIVLNTLYSAEKKPLNKEIALIKQKQIFFGQFEVKNEQSKPVLNSFVSEYNLPQPIDRLYSLLGTFSFLDEQEKNTAVFTEISSKKTVFLKKGDILNGNKIISIDERGVLFESGFGDRFLFTQSGIKYTQTLPKRFFFRVNLKTAMNWLINQPEFLYSVKIVSDNESGFKVQQIEPGSIFERAGLAMNDRILQINETLLKTPDDAFSVWKEILTTGKKLATVKLVRNNKPVELIYILE